MRTDATAARRTSVGSSALFMAAYGSIRSQGGDMRVILAFVISLGILLATASIQAHHSFSATYDGNKPITLRGTIVKMGWQNPHAHLYVDVKNADGKVVTWEVESAGPTTLMKQGLRKEDFVGAEVIIKGFLAKDGTPTVNASSFTLVESKKEFVSDEKTQ
jgi:hypothetical protein